MKNRMKEPRGDVKNYRIYTDVFIPDNTHIEVEHPFYSQKSDEVKNIGGKAYMKIYNIKDIFNAKLNKQFVHIDFFNMTIFISAKKACELKDKLNKLLG